MASLRNLSISALRLGGHTNIAAALRWTARDPCRVAGGNRTPRLPQIPA